LTLARTLGPCLGYTDVVEFIQLYKSNPHKFYLQIQQFWEVRGWELETAFGYTLYFQTQWTKTAAAKPSIPGEFDVELQNVGLVLGSLARGLAEASLF